MVRWPEGKQESVATIPEGVTSIGKEAFDNCSSLESVTIPEGVTSIGDHAFVYCSGLTSVTIPEGVTSIGEEAFDGCSSLKSVTIPKSVTSIGFGAFWNCSSLTSVIIPEGVTSVEGSTFRDCSSLTSITIPEGVTEIGQFAFADCSGLRSIVIPESVTNIGEAASETVFDGCAQLTIYAPVGSYAQKVAADNDIPFQPLENLPQDPAQTPSENPSQTPEQKPSENPSETPSQSPADSQVISLTAEQTTVSKAEMDNLIAENKDSAVVIKLADGIRFTFAKGTMKAVDGKNSYDFGAKVSSDYSGLKNPPIAKDEFVQAISYNYSGNLPAEASISIPVGTKWAGKKLYYYEVTANGTYKYVDSDTVDKDGVLTVQQSHCSDYVITTKALAGAAGSPATGDTGAAVLWTAVLLLAAGTLCAAVRKSRMSGVR